MSSIVDGDGNTTLIQRTTGKIAIVAPFGQMTTTITLDPSTNLAMSIADPMAETVGLTYSPGDLLQTFSDPNTASVHSFVYDPLGRLQTDKSPSGSTKTLTLTTLADGEEVDVSTVMGRKSTHRVETLSDGSMKWTSSGPDGLQTVSTRGADQTGTTTVMPDGTKVAATRGPDPRFGMQAAYATSSTISTPSGLVETTTASRSVALATAGNPLTATQITGTTTINGKTWTTVEDLTKNTVTTTSPAGRVGTLGIDARGRPVRMAAAGIDSLAWAYDSNGRPWSWSMGARSGSLGFDSAGQLHSTTNALNQVTTFTEDGVGRLKSTTWLDGNGLALGYDADGNLKNVTPPGRPAHAFTFWPGDLTETYAPPVVTGSGSTSTTFNYNADDQLKSVSRPDGATVTLGYDSVGRLWTVTFATGVTTFGYDPATGHLTSITGPYSSNVTSKYDGFLLTDVTWSGALSGTYHRTFDNHFRVQSDSVNGASAITYTYDADGLPTAAGAETFTPSPTNGSLSSTSLANLADAYTYDEFGAVQTYTASYAGSAIYSADYGVRDTLGRIITKKETIQGTASTYTYDYDNRGRLWHVWTSGALTATYGYDANGNRSSVTTAGGTIVPTFDDQDRLLTYGTAAFTYGANGELQTKTDGGKGTVYKYDSLGNLTEVDTPTATVQYVVDGRGRRVQKLLGGTAVKGWLYRDALVPIAETDGTGKVTSRFVYGSRGGVPDQIIQGGTTYRVLTDDLGSPRLVVDASSGTVAQRIAYDEWGNVTSDTKPGFQPFGFGGGLYDPDTKLVRFGARDYDATVGRWMTKDPTRFAGGANLYQYCNDRPTTCIDATGALPDDPVAWEHWQAAVEQANREDPNNATFMLWSSLGMAAAGALAAEDAIAAVALRGAFWLRQVWAPATAVASAAGAMCEAEGGEAAEGLGGAGPVLQGQAGVEAAIADIEAAGGRILGREITIEAGGVTTRPDLFAELPSGQQVFIEVKTGASAGYTPNQIAAFPEIWATGGIPRGANAAAAGLTPGVPLGPTPVWTVHYPWPLP